MNRPRTRRSERGQILVLFTLALVAIIAMVGLVLDGGGTFAQRRVEQNASDLAAIAGANAYLNTNSTVTDRTNAAIAAARSSAQRNGYVHGVAGATVTPVVSLLSAGAQVQVDIRAPHNNTFARVIPGQEQWDVSVTATALTGTIDTAFGAAPWTMSIDAFVNGVPKYTSSNPQNFGEGNGDYPNSELDIAWTDYNGNNNVNTAEVRGIINGSNVITATFDFEQYLGQHNQGNHTALYGDVDQYLSDHDVPVPIVGPGSPNCAAPQQSHSNGCFKGWAIFHVISAQGGSSKTITGYFKSDFQAFPLTVGECTPAQQQAGQCGLIETGGPFESVIVRLVK
jgi:Flp pilus assembly protein TadG